MLPAALLLQPLLEGGGWLRSLALLLAGTALAAIGADAWERTRPRWGAALAATGAYLAGAWHHLGAEGPQRTWEALRGSVAGGVSELQVMAAPVPVTPELETLLVLALGAVGTLMVLLAPRRAGAAGFLLLPFLAVPAAVLRESSEAWKLLLLAAGWLLLLSLSEAGGAGRWGQSLGGARRRRPWEAAGGVRTVLLVGVPVLLGASLVPLPSTEPIALPKSGSGTEQRVTYNPLVELQGTLNLPEPKPLLYYERSDGAAQYLRLTTLPVFDEATGWSGETLDGAPAGEATSDDRGRVVTRIQFTGLDTPWLPVPLEGGEVRLDGWRYDEDAETVYSPRLTTSDVGYVEVRTDGDTPSRTELQATSGWERTLPETIQPYAVDPEITPAAAALAEEVTKGARNRFEAAQALQDFFLDPAERFVYDHDTVESAEPGASPLISFLENRRGYCQQYASTYAALARSLGLPVRVAIGFTPGNEVVGGKQEVTTSDAHAWPEVWFEGAGWVRFEPTPRGGVVEPPTYAPEAVAPTRTEAAPGPVAPAPQRPRTELPGPDTEAETPARAAPQAPPEEERGGAGALLAAALGTLLLAPAGTHLLRRRRAARRWPDPLERAWASVTAHAEAAGAETRTSDTPRKSRERIEDLLAGQPGGWEEALKRLAEDVERQRYAPSRAEQERAAGDPGVDARVCNEAIRARLGTDWRGRVRGAWWKAFPPSRPAAGTPGRAPGLSAPERLR